MLPHFDVGLIGHRVARQRNEPRIEKGSSLLMVSGRAIPLGDINARQLLSEMRPLHCRHACVSICHRAFSALI
jgi:hypothetical protein